MAHAPNARRPSQASVSTWRVHLGCLLACCLGFAAVPAGAQDIEPTVEPEASASPSCGWTPAMSDPTPTHVARPWKAGCGVVQVDDDVSVVRQVHLVEIALEDDHTVLRYVLLDAEQRRVVFRLSQRIRHEVQLKRTQKGVTNVRSVNQTDGVYELKLAPGERPEPCELHFILRFDNGTEVLEDWVDDWLFAC